MDYDENCVFNGEINYPIYNIMNKFIITSLISIASITITSWIVGKFFIENIEEEDVPVLFEDKYSLKDMEYDLSRNNELTKNTSVMENTPQGLVIMRYNVDREGFEYWSDTKNMKFDYLETVARKFVIMNFCTNLYIDRYEDIKRQHEEYDILEHEKNDEKNNEKNDEKNNEKNDEKNNETGAPKEQDTNDYSDVFVKHKVKKKVKVDRKKIVAKKSNKYLYIAKINEFEWIKKKEQDAREVSFASFKAMSKIFG
jgi:hypothetical protein